MAFGPFFLLTEILFVLMLIIEQQESGMGNDKTVVLFRKDFTGEITAVMPELPSNHGRLVCYAHIGQHSMCTLDWFLMHTKPASVDEYSSLKSELESLGYDVEARKFMHRDRLAICAGY